MTDTAPHRVQRIPTAPGVELEVLDWGGKGEPVVLLAGLGSSAHVFDDFAPALCKHAHVYAVSRRGYGASSQPKDGYDIATLSSDLLGMLAGLGLERATFIGHSIAGEELSWLGSHAPDHVDKLIYLDAAYDRSTRLPALPPPPEPSAADTASLRAYSNFDERVFGARVPDGEWLSTCEFAPDGRYVSDKTPEKINGMIARSVLVPDYAHILVPALAIYAVPETPAGMLPAARWAALTQTEREQVNQTFAAISQIKRLNREKFRAEVRHGKVVEIPDANHFVFLSHPQQVLSEIVKFLSTSTGKPRVKDFETRLALPVENIASHRSSVTR